MKKLELVVFDFDGVFTDNKVYVTQEGVESICRSRTDSLGINMLQKLHIPLFILSTETNPVVLVNAKKMGINVKESCGDKAEFLKLYCEEYNINLTNVIYMGNDLNDFDAMRLVGFPAAPVDAHPDILQLAEFISKRPGGNGAVRDLCEFIVKGDLI